MHKKVVIVGGVAGGMSCAARLKRLDENAEVVVFEKGNDVSFANCGMPYYIGSVIEDRKKMLVQTPESLEARYRLRVQVRHEVLAIHPERKTVSVKNLDTGESFEENYDHLVLAPGAAPFRPPIPGADQEQVFVLNNLNDMDGIKNRAQAAQNAVIVGGGFIGLELAENLVALGLQVHLVELLDQVLAPMDKEMTQPLAQQLRLNGVHLHLQETVETIDRDRVVLKSGDSLPADLVCLCIGVRPTTDLAREAGLNLGPRGHIEVTETMHTSDPAILAVGDAVQITDFVTGEPTAVPLAGPANRQGRIAADNICDRDSRYRGTQGTSIVKVFNLAAAQTGLTEKRLQGDYLRLYVHPTQHPGYYPDAQPVSLKLLFNREGAILGAQAVGADGVKAIIDTLAVAIRAGLKVEDLEHLELAYSPQWGGAKDPVNMAGFSAANILKGDLQTVEADQAPEDIYWLDVRNKDELEAGMIPGAKHLPLDTLRENLDQLPRDRTIGPYCAVGLRGYLAYRILVQHGFEVRSLNGGFRTWNLFHDPGEAVPTETKTSTPAEPTKTVQLDVCGLQCPGPIAKVKEAMADVGPGEALEVIASDPGFASDIPAWCRATGNTLLEVKPDGKKYRARILSGTEAPTPSGPATREGTTLVCFSNDLDKALAAFIIANGSAAMEKETTIFFTFWGLNILKKNNPGPLKKNLMERMFGFMMPRGPQKLALSKMHMGGLGTGMIKKVMRDKNVMTLPELIQQAKKSRVRLVACAMSMDLMGIHPDELIDGVEIAGVADYLGSAGQGNINLFV